MSQIIVNPKDMTAFAADLDVLAGKMRIREQQLNAGIKALGVNWKDDRYHRFSKSVTEASVQLQAFYNTAARYTAFLRRKAGAAERYLGR